ncbi:MAG: hypothetical protein RJA77_498 [Pseudomonadota bacterium]
MAVYLQVAAGPLHLMLSAEGVHEVTTLDRLRQSERGFVEWRDTVLPLVSVFEFFELHRCTTDRPARRGEDALPVVVYSPSEESTPLALAFDEVVWLKNLPAKHWLALPPVPARTRHFFDAIMNFPETSHQAYRLRRPLKLEDFCSADAWALASEGVLEREL